MSAPRARAAILSVVVVVVVVAGAGACSDTGILLTIERGAVAIDQVKIAVDRPPPASESLGAGTVPSTPRAFATRETLDVALNYNAAADALVDVDVTGLSKGKAVSSARGSILIKGGALVPMALALKAGGPVGEGEGEGEGAGEGEGEGVGEGEGEGAPAVCGDGVIGNGETCDDQNTSGGDGCSSTCQTEPGFVCTGAPSSCALTCGNGNIDNGEDCDDGNLVDGDGCSATCALEIGFACAAANTPCDAVCGDGVLRAGEQCDDGNNNDGDGCSSTCTIENGALCDGEPSVCAPGCVVQGQAVFLGEVDPADSCHACDPSVSATSFAAALPDGAFCDDGLFCDGAGGVCSAGQCASTDASPCVGTTPSCDEGSKTCACSQASCDDGDFCDGIETCGGNGACVAGTDPCAGTAQPICVENGTCRQCNVSADCPDQVSAPFCENGTCIAASSIGCALGQHDGGGQVCAPEGTCNTGFSLPFVDNDGDGVGVGSQLPDCVQLPAAGFAAVGGDCNDHDASVFTLASLFPDKDGDGFTAAGPVTVCVGAATPGFVAGANPPPVIGVDIGSAVNDPNGPGSDWANLGNVAHVDGNFASAGTNQNHPTHGIVLTGFDVRVPDGAAIRGVEVHLLRRSEGGQNFDHVTDALVSLVVGGVATGNNEANGSAWSKADFRDDVYGGSNDTFGLSLSQAQVNDAGFGVEVAADGKNGQTAEIEGAFIEVFVDQGTDCDDGNAGVFSSLAVHEDFDRDGFGVAGETSICVGASPSTPVGFVRLSSGVDCFDRNSDVHPGQARFFNTDRGDGSFDYDCDGNETPAVLDDDVQCTGDCTANTCTPSQQSATNITASCGQQQSVERCRQSCGNCSSFVTTVTVDCH